MNTQSLGGAVSQTSYPGRGIVIGLHGDGARAVAAYFIMGRSANSRNRVFVPDGDGLRTQAFDPSSMADPSLVIYAPVRVLGTRTVVTNGDQTDTIVEVLRRGGTFEGALRTRTFEPDPPIYTPRVSGLLDIGGGRLRYALSILKSMDGGPDHCQRAFFEYGEPVPGLGHYIHTYMGDGDPVPSFEGEPEPVAVRGTIDQIADALWGSLDEANKVALFVRAIDIATGETETRILNKNQ